MSKRLATGMCVLMIAAGAHGQGIPAETSGLQNPGFEYPSEGGESNAPETWISFSSKPGARVGISQSVRKSGLQALALKTAPQNNEFAGIAQSFPAVAGYHYSFGIHVTGDESDRLAGDARGQVHIEWRDAQGKEISRTWGPVWGPDLSSKRWERFFVEGDAPIGAASGVAVITFNARNGGGRGTFYVDDCDFVGGPRVSSSPRRGLTNSPAKLQRHVGPATRRP
jgi:hypothetical protein